MNFFIRYANALEQELNEDRSNIGDIVVDLESIIQKETTATTNDTSSAVVEQTETNIRPIQDGVMPGQTKPTFAPRRVDRRSCETERHMEPQGFEAGVHKTRYSKQPSRRYSGINREEEEFGSNQKENRKRVRTRGKVRVEAQEEARVEQTFKDQWHQH